MVSIERSVCLRAKACLKVKEFGTPNNEAKLSYRDAPVTWHPRVLWCRFSWGPCWATRPNRAH